VGVVAGPGGGWKHFRGKPGFASTSGSPVPTSVIVLVAALFGLGAALVMLGITSGDWLAVLVGAVIVGLVVRTRRQITQRLAGSEQSAGEAATADDDSAAPGGARDLSEAGDAEADDPAQASPVGEQGLGLQAGEATTISTDGGEVLAGSGYAVSDVATGGTIAAERLVLARDGAQAVRVMASAEPDQAELDADALAPGEALVLVPQRSREGRVEAVRVFDEAIDHLVGWLPDDLAPRLSGDLRRGTLRATSLYEWRDDAGQRRGLDVLVHRADVLDTA
jgi:hypothetical protein